jgi:hypothetical protein
VNDDEMNFVASDEVNPESNDSADAGSAQPAHHGRDSKAVFYVLNPVPDAEYAISFFVKER